MRITVLGVPGCPNVPLLRGRLADVLGDSPAEVETVEVTTLAEARRLGMTGSPTLLVDGRDPFAAPGAEPSVSCRLYRDAAGTVAGAPSPAELAAVLGGLGGAAQQA